MGELDMTDPRCAQLETLLDKGPELVEEVEAHFATCPQCRTFVDGGGEIPEVARTLRTTWLSPGLWPRIESALAAEASPQSILFAAPAARSSFGSGRWQMAAAVVLLALLTAIAVLVQRSARIEPDWVVRAAAIDSVESAERAHLEAIDRLAEVAAPQLDAPSTPLLVSYKEKLMLIDDAIAECRSGIRTNRYNAHLRRELLAMYVEKQRTLEEVVNRENHADQKQ
jgi:hypothetical protein